jgi:hypothetical protein
VSSQPAAADSATPDELLEARRFRLAWGLRADYEWVLAVGKNPLAEAGRKEWGVPLLPAEVKELESRSLTGSEFARAIEHYGTSKPQDWAGVFIDQPHGGIIAAQFSGNLAEHTAVIEGLVPAGAPVEVRQVEWSLRELDGFAQTVDAERSWFVATGLLFEAAESDVMANRVRIRYTGPPESETLVRDHFRDRPWAQPTWVGYGWWQGPRGTLTILAVDTAGNPVPDLLADFHPDDPAAEFDTSCSTNAAGSCTLKNFPATTYQIDMNFYFHDTGEYVIVGSGRVEVLADGTATLRIEVSLP